MFMTCWLVSAVVQRIIAGKYICILSHLKLWLPHFIKGFASPKVQDHTAIVIAE